MMRITRLGLAALLAAAGSAQTNPPSYFELLLPNNRAVGGGTNVVVDLPVKQITELTIQVMGSADTNLTYGDLRVRINGKGARNVFDSGSNARGKFLSMTEKTLKMRRDAMFDRQENTIEVYGKDKRGREYYQNWILRNSNTELNPYFTYVSAMSPNDETGIPPDLSVEAPAAPVVFPAGKPSVTVHVKASASAEGGIASLSVNGRPGAAPGKESASIESEAVVARGAKDLTVECIDKKGNSRKVTVPVVYPGSTGPPPKLAGTAWAVIIGVSRFSATTGAPPTLPVAAMDAADLAAALKERGFQESNIKLLVDDRARVEQIRTALGDFTAKAKPEDLLLLYWSTQGLHDPTSPDRVYLSASDTQMLHLADTAIETSELQLLLERVRSRHTILFFDADHPLGGDWGFQGKPIVNTHLLNLFDDQMGRSVLVAGASDGGGSGRSIFSTAITEGLAGKADIDQNHVVTAREICNYVIERVRQATGGNQSARAQISKKEEESPVLALR